MKKDSSLGVLSKYSKISSEKIGSHKSSRQHSKKNSYSDKEIPMSKTKKIQPLPPLQMNKVPGVYDNNQAVLEY